MSMQGRNRAAATGAAWTEAEHCGTLAALRLMGADPGSQLRSPICLTAESDAHSHPVCRGGGSVPLY